MMERIRDRLFDAEMDSEVAALDALTEAAQLVVSRWQSGDLAEAVRELSAALDELR